MNEMSKYDVDEAETRDIKAQVPGAGPQLIARLRHHRLVSTSLKQATGLCEMYTTKLVNIVAWMDRGMSLARVEQCLEVRQLMEIQSVLIIDKVLESCDFKTGLPLDVLEAFQPIVTQIGGHTPWHALMHRIEESYGGNVLSAYHACLEDEGDFVEVIMRKCDPMTGHLNSIAHDLGNRRSKEKEE